MFGFLNIYKPTGITSHDVVSILRKITNIKQIGHTGTLDPFAEGVLPICIGKSTKLIEYLNDDKAYIGTIQLGISTTTYDTEGDIVNTSEKVVNIKEINLILENFKGNIEQTPPIYSALKYKGKKLYEYARNGEKVDIQPRKVIIHKLDILSYDANTKKLEILIECSKGTYIRSIANDIGEKLKTYGHLCKLVRIKAGCFKIENAVKLEQLKTIEDVNKSLINPLKCLNYPAFSINSDEYKLISNGNSIRTNMVDGITIITYANQIIAIGSVREHIFYPQKVFI